VQQFVHLAGRARKEGLLALEQEVASIEHPLLKKGITMVVDGTDPEVVKSVLNIDVAAKEARHEVGIVLFESLGGYAPTLGIIGTVLGLIRVLGSTSNAADLAPAIAVAFTATLYGVGSANLLWLPVASKLKRRSAYEAELDALIIDGVEAIQNGDNPHIVEEKLAGYLTPTKGAKAAAPDAAAAAQAGGASPAPRRATGAPSRAGS
jgi:chemotaxis protein MotA